MMKRLLFMLAFLVSFGFAAVGQEDLVTTEIVLKESGTLLDLLTDAQIEQTEKIIITGDGLLPTDFSVLKTMLIKHNLKEIDIENTTTSSISERAFEGCQNLTSIKLPKFLMSTGWLGFTGCSGLTEISLPVSVVTIPHSFRGCSSLTSITIGRNVQSIDGQSFLYCYNLQEVHCKGTVPPACQLGSFESSYSTCTLYVPEGYKKTYAFADGWLNFENIQEEYVEPPYQLQVEMNGGVEASRVYPLYYAQGGYIVTKIIPAQECIIEAEKDETIVIEIPNQNSTQNNWKIESIYLNDEDYTSQLDPFNRLYLKIDHDSKLVINMMDAYMPTEDNVISVALNEAGTLQNKLSEIPLTSITGLIVSGPMNSTDFETMDQIPYLNQVDLSGAVLEDNEIPQYAFQKENSVLKKVILPITTTTIGRFAFQGCIYNHRTTKTNQKYPSVNL